MGCTGCATNAKDGAPRGCQSKGSCLTGGCNKLNTYDWLASLDIADVDNFDIVEVSFKNGARKSFFKNGYGSKLVTGDLVVVETGAGTDVGQISLSGELVKMQMKKKRLRDDFIFHKIIRRANDRDVERLDEARKLEHATLVRSRVIARTLGLEMKVGDIEYQADLRKATFYYTADGRVDFRELIRHYAKEFKVKIEMRQIGMRQESGRIGGLGSCGRELCCSTWLTDFRSVTTSAARYQNLAINQSKLSGQCGRLKCCLNYELDLYVDTLKEFPKNVDELKLASGRASLIKVDIFKKQMYYAIESEFGRSKIQPLSVDVVKQIKEMNERGEKPSDVILVQPEVEEVLDYEDVTGAVELPMEKKKGRKRGKRRNWKGNNRSGNKKK